MAPEVVACGDSSSAAPYDPTVADVWSLGIVLFILLTGSPLISDETPGGRAATLQVLQQRNGGIGKILAMWDLAKLMAPATVDLLAIMLQVDPSKRASVEQVLAHPALSLFAKA